MKSLKAAIKRADEMSKGNYPETTFVVFSRDEYDIPGNNYHVAYEHDLDTFYCNDQVVYCSDE